MAIGDQVHWMGSAGNTDLRPSSGVETVSYTHLTLPTKA